MKNSGIFKTIIGITFCLLLVGVFAGVGQAEEFDTLVLHGDGYPEMPDLFIYGDSDVVNGVTCYSGLSQFGSYTRASSDATLFPPPLPIMPYAHFTHGFYTGLQWKNWASIDMALGTITFAVAQNVIDGSITSSPHPMLLHKSDKREFPVQPG